jgi:4-hydroxybenzoate polyprenyltransferase
MTIVKNQSTYDIVGFQRENLALKLLVTKDFIRDEFVYGGHLLSLGSAAVALSTMLLLGMMIQWEFLLIAYLCPLCIYSYDHYRDIERDALNNSHRTTHLRKYHKIHPLIIVMYGVAFFALLFYFGNILSVIFGGSLLLVGLFYTKYVKILTTKIIGFKSFYTSFSVASLILFTGIYCSYPVGLVLLLLFVFLFFRFMVNTCFCDIKDIVTDRKYRIKTLPVILGKEKFLIVLHVINIISLIPLLIGVYLHVLPLFSLLLVASILYSVYYIEKAKHQGANMQSLSSIVVDGEFAFWPFILFAGSSLPSLFL